MAALEVASRFAVDPRWLIHLPPTMAAPPTAPEGPFLEHPAQALEFFASRGITDLVAVGAIAVFNERGIKVPEDISIMGFSNWFLSSAITPSLSTVDQPGYEMGKTTFKLLYKEMKAKKKEESITPQTRILETAVVKRNSTL